MSEITPTSIDDARKICKEFADQCVALVCDLKRPPKGSLRMAVTCADGEVREFLLVLTNV